MTGFNVPLYPPCPYVVQKQTEEPPTRDIVLGSDRCAASFRDAERQHECVRHRGHDGLCHCGCVGWKAVNHPHAEDPGSNRGVGWVLSVLLVVVCGIALAFLRP